jgi:hypothetical protein
MKATIKEVHNIYGSFFRVYAEKELVHCFSFEMASKQVAKQKAFNLAKNIENIKEPESIETIYQTS